MNNHRAAAFVVLSFFALSSVLVAKDFKLYYLGGQSNMDGYGYTKELPAHLQHQFEGVYIFHGNTLKDGGLVGGQGQWANLQPGHGVGFSSNGDENGYSDRFGVELSFAHYLQKLDPETSIALIKYSRGGTSIHCLAADRFGCWDPDFSGGSGSGKGINQYDHFLSTVRNALKIKDIDGDGEDDNLIPSGIVWMQGESDAVLPKTARTYENNLKRLMDLVRAAFLRDDIPVVIGRISDSGQDESGHVWRFGNMVRWAQTQFVKKDAAASLVSTTDNYGYSDKWHYDSEGYIDLGIQFAKALIEIE